ncbi:polymorphic toxin-type HINT domain-containing protein [Gimesia aquarii]|uniref:Uncharacterized protein n=1 Tax=Gimesia aquarii TaxID=2527964 RepID=A0A517WSD2_9PLAN|nr:polymorphic toxin-type HINT domain-containing protein [Gimesia aquarii]QDU08166.1 hypothetical protein V202x_15300 [Gimesia aquarii]
MLAIKACPPIAANPGPGFQVVTGTFQHQAAKILDINVEGESKPIGTTPNHPFWSVDRQEFVRADSLTVGEHLQTLKGITTITKISPRGPPEPVYNLEVQVKHTYYVADTGVLVHNRAPCSAGGGADINRALQNMTSDEARRIQNAANRIRKPIHLVGSRAGGSKLPRIDSDWDFVIEANNKIRRSASRSLPGGKSIQRGEAWNQDLFKGPLKEHLPHITFYPE